MDNFDSKITKGQLKTLKLLEKIISQKQQKDLKIIPDLSLSKYAKIGNCNENLVCEILRKYVDS